jgi:hypothetical protein
MNEYPLPDIKFTSSSLELVLPYSWIISGIIIVGISFLILYWWVFYEPGMRCD